MYESVDISNFCNDQLSIGDPVEYCRDQMYPNIVRKYRGGVFAGVSINSVVDIGCADFRQLRYEEVRVGSKIGVATSGCQVNMPIVGNPGDYIRPKKDGTWKVGCKRKNAVGQIVQSSSDRSIVRLI